MLTNLDRLYESCETMRGGNSNKSKVFFWDKPETHLILVSFYLKYEIADYVKCISLMKFSWPKTLVKKWFNIRSKAEDFHADDADYGGDLIGFFFFFLFSCMSFRLLIWFLDLEYLAFYKPRTNRGFCFWKWKLSWF